jgi:hypothetical protein
VEGRGDSSCSAIFFQSFYHKIAKGMKIETPPSRFSYNPINRICPKTSRPFLGFEVFWSPNTFENVLSFKGFVLFSSVSIFQTKACFPQMKRIFKI